jgi:hypothetical protein
MKIEKWTLGLAAVGLVTLSPGLVAQSAAPLVPVQTALSATTISGYVDTSAVWNPGTGNANPAPYALNAGKQDGFNLDSVDLRIEKGLDDAQWSAGYVLELSYGPDARIIDGGAYPIRQAFVTLRTPVGNGIDWQIGRWDSLLGKESNDNYNNANFTRSYAKAFEPTENTGLLVSYKVNDSINLQAGVADTLSTEGTSVNARAGTGQYTVESKKAVLTLVTLTAPDQWGFLKGSTLFGGFDHGQGVNTADRTEWFVGTTVTTPIKDLTLGASYDLIDHADVVAPAGAGFGAASADAGYFYSVAAYGSYKATDKLSFHTRFEWADGEALGGLQDAEVGAASVAPGQFAPNALDKVLALTGTVQYDLWANVISRLEVRWDHSCSGADTFGGNGPLGTVLPDKKNEVIIAANVIYKF